MDLLSWLTEGQSLPEELPSPSSLPPPEFLSIRKSKPLKAKGERAGSAHVLTPLESQLKDIVVSLYSDKETVPGAERKNRVSLRDTENHRSLPTSVRLTPEGSSFSDSELAAQSSLSLHFDRSLSSPGAHSDRRIERKQPESLVAFSDNGEESLSWPRSEKVEQSNKAMSGTAPRTSGFIFSAEDTAWDHTDPEAPPIPPVVGPQYPTDHPSFREPFSNEGGELNRPLALRQLESKAFSVQPDALLYMYSHTDSSYGKPYPPKPSSVTSEPRSGVIESFGIEPLEFQTQRLSQIHSSPSSWTGGSESHGSPERESVDGARSLETGTRDRSLTPVADAATTWAQRQQASQEDDSPVLSSTGSSTPHSAEAPTHHFEQPPPKPHDPSVYALAGLDDVETNSVVSVQLLTESLQNEPPDVHSLLNDDMQESGDNLVPFALSVKQRDRDDSLAHSPSVPKRPLPFEKPLESPTAVKLPYHLQPSPKLPRQPPHMPNKPSLTDPFSPLSSTPAPTAKPVHGLGLPPPRRTASTSSAGTSDFPDETEERVKALEHELTQALQAKANLEGQVESIVSECKEALKNRAELQMMLAKAEAELSEMADALTRARDEQRPLKGGTEGPALQKELEAVKQELREAEDREMRAVEQHRQQADREKQAVKTLKDDLAESQKAKEKTISELQDKLKSTQTALEDQVSENQEAACKLSSLEASYDALEGTKSWLHDQLQEALQSKMKLQEELREAKTGALAHGIKADQLHKENEALQSKVTDLQKGVLQDKARLVSELEAIEADVLSREDSYAQLVAERSQLEDLASMRGRDIEQLNHNLARAQVLNETLEQKLGEISPERDALVRETQSLKRKNKELEEALSSSQQELDAKAADLTELEKLKSTLQERLRQSDASLLNKEGTVQGLNEAKEILQQEVEMEQQARDAMDKELGDAKKEAAELEGELKAALDKNREKDALLKDLAHTQQCLAGEKLSLEAKLSEKEQELADKTKQQRAFETQSSELVDEFKSLQGQFHSIAAESGVVKDDVAEKDRVISHLSAEKQQMQEELGALRKETEHNRDKLAQVQHEKARLEGTIEASSATNLKEFQRAIQDKAQLQADLNALRVSQQRDAIKSQARANRLEGDLKSANKDAARARKELEKLQLEREECAQRLQDDVSRLEGEVGSLRGRLDKALRDKERVEGIVAALKPSEGRVENLSADCERLSRQNQELAEQLQFEATQRAEVERASGIVAMKLKQNAEEQKSGLEEQLKDSSLELERLRGRLAGLNTTQLALRDHTSSLEATLAKKESALIKLSAQVQKVLEEKQLEDQAFADKIDNLERDLDQVRLEAKTHKDREQFIAKKVSDLEQEVRQKNIEVENLKESLIPDELPLLEKKVAKLTKDKDALHNEIGSLKSQLVKARASESGAKRELADRNSQIDILTRELKLAKAREKQTEGEIKQLQDSLIALDERHASEMSMLQQQQPPSRGSPSGRALQSTAAALEGRGHGEEGLFDANLSSIGLDEADRPLHADTSEGSLASQEHKPDMDKVGHLNDALRTSSQQTINQLMGYNSLYRAHLKEMGSRLETARRQGQEAAEIKKEGEISVLRNELGSRSRTLGSLQSCLSSLKQDMGKLHQQMDQHSATIHASHDSSRQLESRLEDLKRNSSLP